MRGIHACSSKTRMAAALFGNDNTCGSLILVLLLYLAVNLPANAQQDRNYDSFNDRYRINVGGFFPSMRSKIAINADVESIGSELNGQFDLEYYGPVVYLSASF